MRILNLLLGYDYFIAYSRRDGAEYALALADALAEAGLKCFVDRPIPVAEQGMPSIRRALHASRFFILIGTEWATRSDLVRHELEAFTNGETDRPDRFRAPPGDT